MLLIEVSAVQTILNTLRRERVASYLLEYEMTKLLKPFLAIGNAFARRLLQSRFHWLLSGKVVLLHVTGRKSGRLYLLYLVPVNYRQTENGISVMTYRARQWWPNIRDADELPIVLRGNLILAVSEVVTDDLDVIAAGLLDRGWARRSMVRATAKDSVLIRLRVAEGEM